MYVHKPQVRVLRQTDQGESEKDDWPEGRQRPGKPPPYKGFKLQKGEKAAIEAIMRENMEKRKFKQPLSFPNAGSTFKRPQGAFAGKLIEDAGLKGFSVGGAQVSEKHAGFVINTGNATSTDVLALTDKIKQEVFSKFGIKLELEIIYVK